MIPFPVFHFWNIFAVASNIFFVLFQKGFELFDGRFDFGGQSFVLFSNLLQCIDHQVVAVCFVLDHHVEWSGGGTLLLVSMDAKSVVSVVGKNQISDRTGVSMKIVDDGTGFCEIFLKILLGDEWIFLISKTQGGQLRNMYESAL